MTATRYARGRLPAVYTRRTVRSALAMRAALDPLGPAPAACADYLSARRSLAPQMWYNDVCGDCTAVDTANRLVLRTANVGPVVLVPTTPQVVALYSAVSGYVPGDDATDVGASEDAMCAYLRTTGFLGHVALSTGAIEPSNLDHVKWGCQLFGGVRLGLNLPRYADDQFYDGRPWDVSSHGDQETDGHDVALVDFRGDALRVDTWGRTIEMTPAAFRAWCDECHAELYPDWIRAQSGAAPSGFLLSALVDMMREVDS